LEPELRLVEIDGTVTVGEEVEPETTETMIEVELLTLSLRQS